MRQINVVVGGIPNPIGGVTTFIKRLVQTEKSISHLVDLYPSEGKVVPAEYSGVYVYSQRKIISLIRLALLCIRGNGRFFFNFSTPKSLLLLLLLPKRKSKWFVMLHHGDLNAGKYGAVARWVLSRKVDVALAMNARQVSWYEQFVEMKKIKVASSYMPPAPGAGLIAPEELKATIHNIRSKFGNLFVCSGYPTPIYRHLLAIDLMRLRKSDFLFCCLYGEGEEMNEIRQLASMMDNVMVFERLSEDEFNFILRSSDLYLRLNLEDSLGVAVGDAVNFGVKCLATNVCKRYKGAALVQADMAVDMLDASVDKVLRQDDSVLYELDGVLEFSYKELL
ncbi:hypothetical protein [Halopseudomonas sp.]|uniref:hypothetical protein n=1 Tax=Halopseudomonas sp. TaxID=2901191 RepID=UPI0030033902